MERAIFVDKAGYDKVLSEIIKMKLIIINQIQPFQVLLWNQIQQK